MVLRVDGLHFDLRWKVALGVDLEEQPIAKIMLQLFQQSNGLGRHLESMRSAPRNDAASYQELSTDDV
jgi:hypothetical protein